MKNILTTIATAFFAALFFNAALTLTQDHRTVWQYDHWRAVYRAEQDRQARAAWLAAEFARTNRDPAWAWVGGGAVCITNSSIINSFVIMGNSGWGSTSYFSLGFNTNDAHGDTPPSFRAGDLELGYRRDGTVVFRKPPELEPKLTLREAAEAGKRKVLDAVTNL